IVTGMVSRWAVLDIDPRNEGLETLVELDAIGAQMPDNGPVDETGSLGLPHHFALDVPLAKAAPFTGIEGQADGGRVAAPPSLHAPGRRYRWLRDLSHRAEPLPDWIRWACERSSKSVKPQAPAVVVPLVPRLDAGADDVLGALSRAGLYIARHRRAGMH